MKPLDLDLYEIREEVKPNSWKNLNA